MCDAFYEKIKILYEEIFLSKSPSVLESITKIVSDKLRATLRIDYPLFIQKVSNQTHHFKLFP